MPVIAMRGAIDRSHIADLCRRHTSSRRVRWDLKMSSSSRAWFEQNLRLQSQAYSTVVLIDANNINPALQFDADVCRRAVACAARELGEGGGRQPLVIAFNRPALPNVSLNAGSSSSFQHSCDVRVRGSTAFSQSGGMQLLHHAGQRKHGTSALLGVL